MDIYVFWEISPLKDGGLITMYLVLLAFKDGRFAQNQLNKELINALALL